MIDIALLAHTGPCKKFLAGEHFPCSVDSGELDREMYILLSGRVDVYRISAAGGTQTVGSALPGDVFGGREFFTESDDNIYTAGVDSIVYIITKSTFDELSWTHPDILFEVLRAAYTPLRKLTALQKTTVGVTANEYTAKSKTTVEQTDAKTAMESNLQTRVTEQQTASGAQTRAQEQAVAEAQMRAQEQAVAGAQMKAQEQAAAGAQMKAQEQAAAGAQMKAQEQAAAGAQMRAQEQAAAGAQMRAQEQAVAGAQMRAQEQAVAGAQKIAQEQVVSGAQPNVSGQHGAETRKILPERADSMAQKHAALSAMIAESGIYPQGHKPYPGVIRPEYAQLIFLKDYDCPYCKKHFTDFKVFRSKLYESAPIRFDLRRYYHNFQTEWFDVITCHNCFFSTIYNYFTEPKPIQKVLIESKLDAARASIHLDFDTERDIDFVFTAHYLALMCADGYLSIGRQIRAKLWGNLSWLYEDVEDGEMAKYAAGKAVEAYEAVYKETHLTPVQEQITCLSIAGMQFRAGIDRNLKKYLFTAKTIKMGDRTYAKLAEDFMYELRMEDE